MAVMMRRRDQILKIIQNKSGASILFVLAVMLLLMTIGVSVLTAASTNLGSGMNKKTGNQLNLYADNMQKSIMYSLQTGSSDEGRDITSSTDGPETLGGQILGAAAVAAVPGDPIEMKFKPTLSDGLELSNIAVTVKVTPTVMTTPEVDEQPEVKDAEGNIISPPVAGQPKTTVISGSAVVTVTVTLREKSVITVAVYDFSEGLIKGNFIDNAGKWRLISHEKTDK